MILLEGELELALFRRCKHSIVQTEDGMLLIGARGCAVGPKTMDCAGEFEADAAIDGKA